MSKYRKRYETPAKSYNLVAYKKDNYYLKQIIKIACIAVAVAVGVFAFVKYALPFFSDLINGVDPTERYKPKVEATFDLEGQSDGYGVETQLKADEVVSNYSTKNDPFMQDGVIVFSTDTDKSDGLFLNTIVLYDTKTGEETEINPEKKYDNILQTRLTGKYIVYVDCMVNGGGRICVYDTETGEQFVIKEFGYAIPNISISGNYVAFVQQTGEGNQKLYLYDLETRQNVTMRKYDASVTCGNVDISQNDIVWAEYTTEGKGVIKKLDISSGSAKISTCEFGQKVFEPKTNGTDIIYCTSMGQSTGDLMLSVNGGAPFKISDNVLNYDIGGDYIVFSKDETIYECRIDNLMITKTLTPETMRGLLSSVNGSEVCFYDTTDGMGLIDTVRYIDIED